MMTFSGNNSDVAEFVVDQLMSRPRFDWQSITITPQGKSGVCFVRIATDGLWDDIVEKMVCLYSLRRQSI